MNAQLKKIMSGVFKDTGWKLVKGTMSGIGVLIGIFIMSFPLIPLLKWLYRFITFYWSVF